MKIRVILVVAILQIIHGCASFSKVQNQALDPKSRGIKYNVESFNSLHDLQDNLIILAFSGGGTRAAALSYGVLQELEATPIYKGDKSKTALDDVDIISSVSGGSFTAAYYGLFGKKIFEDFESDFLRQSVEGALISKMFNPGYWFRSLITGFNRTELAIEYYDQNVFKRKTFSDMPLGRRPFITINATDLSLGSRFAFNQDTFDLICSDLSDFSVARAVTASSAVPMLFPSVVVKNHSGSCESLEPISDVRLSGSSQVLESYSKMVRAYSDSQSREYLHLVDGGLTDNLGLRAISDHFEIFGVNANDTEAKSSPKRVLLILVNSSVTPKREMDTSSDIPALSETLDAVSEALIQNRNLDTKSYFFNQQNEFEDKIRSLSPGMEFFITEVSFNSLEDETQIRLFNQFPTSLELEDEQIDLLIETGRTLLRESPQFIDFKESALKE